MNTYMPQPGDEEMIEPWSLVPAPKPARGKLTPHQREVYNRLVRISRRPSGGEYVWIDWRYLGSRGGLAKLVAKGWVEVEMHYGPQGGEHPSYRPLIVEES